jgi:hypothetical protein
VAGRDWRGGKGPGFGMIGREGVGPGAGDLEEGPGERDRVAERLIEGWDCGGTEVSEREVGTSCPLLVVGPLIEI